MPTYLKTNVAWFHSKENPGWTLSNMAGGMPLFWPVERILTDFCCPKESCEVQVEQLLPLSPRVIYAKPTLHCHRPAR